MLNIYPEAHAKNLFGQSNKRKMTETVKLVKVKVKVKNLQKDSYATNASVNEDKD